METFSVIIGVDPGKMTGLAYYDHSNLTLGSWELPMDDFITWADNALTNSPGNYVVACEDFRITMQTAKKSQGDRQWSLEQIGVLRFLCRKYGHTFELTTSADAKTFSTDRKLKGAGWWNPGNGHANDAARQVLIALARRNVLVPGSFDGN